MNRVLTPEEGEPMKDVTNEYLQKICTELNCRGIILIVTDSYIPCPDSLAGEPCQHTHLMASGINGLSGAAVMTLAAEAVTRSLSK